MGRLYQEGGKTSWTGSIYKKTVRRNKKGKIVHSSRYPRYSPNGIVWVEEKDTVNLVYSVPFGGTPLAYEQKRKSPYSDDELARKIQKQKRNLFLKRQRILRQRGINLR